MSVKWVVMQDETVSSECTPLRWDIYEQLDEVFTSLKLAYPEMWFTFRVGASPDDVLLYVYPFSCHDAHDPCLALNLDGVDELSERELSHIKRHCERWAENYHTWCVSSGTSSVQGDTLNIPTDKELLIVPPEGEAVRVRIDKAKHRIDWEKETGEGRDDGDLEFVIRPKQ